ncbi:LADA_0D12992g1_1 [Lachancea dasiensis]|uniref:LADA_0D12992g1_1 n=1 Tax=Lachancea dasiensis TaxID=1072105 RepID=A0A1G4J8Q2_9SACH|nr:LADA_0D12992g1_1 [Lachancea dasiensis]
MKAQKVDKPKDQRRAKTFTGCWTCRARKIKCDLRKPTCLRCEKSGFECGGYDIKLQWSQPIQFNRFGQVAPVSHTSTGSSSDEPSSQRRDIAFVKYKEEYEYYEDMDDELSSLHSPPLDRIADNKTWMIKKFAVFRGTDKSKIQHVPRRKRRKLVHSVSQAGSSPASQGKSRQRSVSSLAESRTDGVNVPRRDSAKLDTHNNTDLPSASSVAELFNFDFSSINFKGHEWISNELRDDALLSAFAIQKLNSNTPVGTPRETSKTLITDESLRPSLADQAEQFQLCSSNDNEDLSQIYRILFHRNDDRPRSKAQSSVSKLIESTSRPSVVPLENMILIDSSSAEGHMPKEVLEVVNSAIPEPSIFNLPGNDNLLLNLPTTGLTVKGLTRFLLNYYLKNVVDLMTVVALPTNPWRTIYFPRALQAIGDLAGIGYTSNSRNSLLNAILAISCFNLQSKFPKNSPAMKYYLQLGIELRGQASSFLKCCLESGTKQERYKDIVTAILSMNSIDVVWGTMADCQYHLGLCEDLIEERMKSRPKISEKARSLHRIFSFLKLIQDSTALDKVTEKEIVVLAPAPNGDQTHLFSEMQEQPDGAENFGSPREGEFKESLDKDNGKIRIEYVRQSNFGASTPIFSNIASQSYSHAKNTKRSSNFLSTDALYGLPNSLILLFSDCVRLARHREFYRMKSIEVPSSFIKLCAAFEVKLFNWKSEWEFFEPYTEKFVNDTVEGVYHHSMSFYHSLIIYYQTMVRSTNHEEVQVNVLEVLVHLNTLTDLIQHKGIKIVPLIWQGFMAGCAAISTNLQIQFKEWAAKHARSGIGSYWGARQIMFEVWRRRLNGENCDNWFDVYKDWEMNLMLS